MSNPWRAQVNQKLYFVQLLLIDAQAKTGPALQAVLQGAVFHLSTAYRLYLKEIAQQQNHSTDAIDARSARRQFAAQEWHCQELEVLAQLEEQGQWPLRLLQAMREAEGETAPKAMRPAATVIAVADITETVDVAICQQWLQAFQALIATQREAAQEW